MNPGQVSSLPPALHDDYVRAFTDSLSTVFLIAAAVWRRLTASGQAIRRELMRARLSEELPHSDRGA